METAIKVKIEDEMTELESPINVHKNIEGYENSERHEEIISVIIINNQQNDNPFSKTKHIIFKNNFTLQLINPSIQAKFDEELYRFSKSELVFFILIFVFYFTGYACYLYFSEYIVLVNLKKQIDIYNIVFIVLMISSTITYILKNIFKKNLIIAKIYKYLFLACVTGIVMVLNNIIYFSTNPVNIRE